MIIKRILSGVIAVAIVFLIVAPLVSKFSSISADKASADLRRFRLLENYTPFDLDTNGFSDLLAFEQTSSGGIFHGRLLSGVDGPQPMIGPQPGSDQRPKSSKSGEFGQALSWAVAPVGSVPVPGDFNGDGVTDLATFRASQADLPGGATWTIYYSHTVKEQVILQRTTKEVRWGTPDAVPVPADYNADGITDIAVFDRPTGMWAILYGADTFNLGTAGVSGFDNGRSVQWGLPSDQPVPGDYNGDGKADLGLVRRRDDKGSLIWLVAFVPTEASPQLRHFSVEFGSREDTPVPGDYDCDGKTDIAVFERRTGLWRIYRKGQPSQDLKWIVDAGHPFAADYDGDGCDDFAFYVPQGEFHYYILNSRFKGEIRDLFGEKHPAVSRYRWGSADARPIQLWLQEAYLPKGN